MIICASLLEEPVSGLRPLKKMGVWAPTHLQSCWRRVQLSPLSKREKKTEVSVTAETFKQQIVQTTSHCHMKNRRQKAVYYATFDAVFGDNLLSDTLHVDHQCHCTYLSCVLRSPAANLQVASITFILLQTLQLVAHYIS